MKNAKAKGVKIGRVRKRNDLLIHSLLDAGLSFREIARIALCSHGSVSASKKEWIVKKAEAARKKQEEEAAKVATEPVLAVEVLNATAPVAAPLTHDDQFPQTYD